MTREQIIELAKQCGAVECLYEFSLTDDALEAFFHAAQQAEREACERTCIEVGKRKAVCSAFDCADAIRNRSKP